MTRIRLEPRGVVISGHAGAGEYGSDTVCAALSILMYTLREIPGARAAEADGFCAVKVPRRNRRELRAVARGFYLLAENFPEYVSVADGELGNHTKTKSLSLRTIAHDGVAISAIMHKLTTLRRTEAF